MLGDADARVHRRGLPLAEGGALEARSHVPRVGRFLRIGHVLRISRVGHDGGEMPGELAGAGEGRGAHVGAGEALQALEVGALLGELPGSEQRARAPA